MNSQNNEDSMNFSMIDKPEDAKPALDFSLPSLLQQEPVHPKPIETEPASLQKSVEYVFSKIKKIAIPSAPPGLKPQKDENGFLYALERMEKELSFQSESYNIYDQNPNFQTQIIQNNKSKTLSCLKTTKETNKSTNRSANQQSIAFNDYFGPLIIDFKKKESKIEAAEKVKKQLKPEKDNKSLSKSGSNVSNDKTEALKIKERRNTKSKSKELQSVLRLREKSKSSKNYLLPFDFRKSKNKFSNLDKRSVSRSHSNLKKSSQADTYASKVFTEYYGTSMNFKSIPELKQKKQQGFNLNKIKSRQKSKSKQKLGMLSPRGKVSQVIARK